MDSHSDKPIANIAIYRLDIYRLLTLLLADEQIAKNKIFSQLGDRFAEDEINRLLVLIAVISRQLLDYGYQQDKICGKTINKSTKRSKELGFRKACNVIIHAKDIVIRNDYFSFEDGIGTVLEQSYFYFCDSIKIVTDNKENVDINLLKFLAHCIELSDKIKEVQYDSI